MSIFIIFYSCDKIPDISNLKEKRFISAHSFRRCRPSLLDLVWLIITSWQAERDSEDVLHLSEDRKQRVRKGLGAKYNPQSPPKV
jgi:siroheme synthase (precorrin-2 oxidase/ferrochelatase)